MSSDQKFFDMYSLIIGLLVIFTFAILILAFWLADRTQGVFTQEGEEYRAAVAERIQPVGRAYLPGEEAETQLLATAAEPEPVAAQLSGPQVYNQACLACHGAGIAGAPILGDIENWAPRIVQGIDILNDHAINGFTGDAGYMPPKGGRVDLSDEEVISAVEYMVAESQ